MRAAVLLLMAGLCRYSAAMDGIVILVLASGRGERFRASGGTGSKLRALLAGQPVLEHTVAAARASGLACHVEDAGHAGMGDSIAAAVRATAGAAGWLVLPGDLPLVRPASIRAVAQALAQHEVVVPTWQGERGHPVGFARACRDELLALTGPLGAGRLLKARAGTPALALLPLPDPGIRIDIDTVQDLAAAERALAAGG
jgi:molybdenum cofactor cytidylyltransferase